MTDSYSLELTYSGKNIFTIAIDGVPYTKRFSGNWDGKNHFNYIKESDKTKEETIKYLSGTDLLSSLYPVEMDSYLPFIKITNIIHKFDVKDGFLIIHGSYEIDTDNYGTSDEEYDDDYPNDFIYGFSYDEHIYDRTNDDGIRCVSEDSGNCDGCFYFKTTTFYPLLEETDYYFRTIDYSFYFKGLDKNGQKIIFKKSSSFLEDFALTEEFKIKLFSAWS